jgi:signal transduction histidine kinase
MTLNLYLTILLLLSTLCSLFIAFLAWKKRQNSIAISLFFGMLSSAFYSFGYAFEIASTNLDQITFWLKVEYIGIAFGTYIWFIMVLKYTNVYIKIRKQIYVVLLIIPAITFITHYTNHWHLLFYKTISIHNTSGHPVVAFIPGPAYILHVIFSYVLFITGMGLLYRMFRRATSRMKKQIALVMIGSCGPYLITFIYLMDILPTSYDLSPFGFLFSGIFFMWAIYQFNMMKLAPVAFQKVFESMEEAVIILDLDNSIINFNQSAIKVFPTLNKKAIGIDAYKWFSDYPTLLEIISQLPTTHPRVNIFNYTNPTYFTIQASYVSNKKLKPVAKMLLLREITQSVLAEDTLRSNEEKLRELNRFKDVMFTVVAHDIRDPLSMLVNLMELLKEDITFYGERHSEITLEMDKQINKTFNFIESLLDWFRNQSDGMVFHPVACNLSYAVQVNTRLLQLQSDIKQIQIVSTISNDTVIYADIDMLNMIIRNLLSNAIKYTGNGGSIVISAVKKGENMIISIEDSGVGILPDQAEQLLTEDYPHSMVGTFGERGNGIGLLLTKEFIRINRGEIWFESLPGQGSTFYFSIPFLLDQNEDSADEERRNVI